MNMLTFIGGGIMFIILVLFLSMAWSRKKQIEQDVNISWSGSQIDLQPKDYVVIEDDGYRLNEEKK